MHHVGKLHVSWGKTTCIMGKNYMYHGEKLHASWGKTTCIMGKKLHVKFKFLEHKLNKLNNNFEMSIFKLLNLEIRKH